MKTYDIVVPWHKQTLLCEVLYKCRLCNKYEKYRAMNNVPKHAHLCTAHFNELAESQKNDYMGVESKS